MNGVQFLLLGITVSLTALLLEKHKGYPIMLVAAGGIAVLLFASDHLNSLLQFLGKIESQTGISSVYLRIVYKAIGICILSEFAVSVCIDNKHTSLARALEFSAKCLILVSAIPIFQDVLNVISELLK